jgi:hypothetical protein
MANANHLLIGLGGTGGKIIRSLRKAVFQRFGGEQTKGANLRYLYIDSSDKMMKHDDPTWRIFGQSVQLPFWGQLLISGLNLAGVLDNIGSYPGIAPWIANREAFRGLLNSANAPIAAREIIASASRQSEITLVTLTNLFPARFVDDVSFLRDCYHGRVTGSDLEQAKFELHSEGDGASLPDLFMPEADPTIPCPSLDREGHRLGSVVRT